MDWEHVVPRSGGFCQWAELSLTMEMRLRCRSLKAMLGGIGLHREEQSRFFVS